MALVPHPNGKTPDEHLDAAVEPRKWEVVCKATDDELRQSGHGIKTVCFAHQSGDLIVAGSSKPTVQVYKIAEAKIAVTQNLRLGAVGCSYVESQTVDRQFVAVCYDDGCTGLWDLRTAKIALQLDTSVGNGLRVKFLPESHRLVSGGTSGNLAFWDLRTCRSDFLISPDSAPSLPKKADPEEPMTKKRKGDRHENYRPKPSSPVYSLDISPDGRLLGCGRGSGDVSLMKLPTGGEQPHFLSDVNSHRGETSASRPAEGAMPVRGLCFDPASRLLLSGGDDNHVCVFDAAAWARPRAQDETRWPQLERFAAHRGWVSFTGVCPDPRQRTVVSASWDGTVKIWDYSTHAVLRTYKEHKDCVLAGAMSSLDGGKLFVTAGADAQLCVFSSGDA